MCSSKLIKPRRVVGTSSLQLVESQVKTWTCNWCLQCACGGGSRLVGLSPPGLRHCLRCGIYLPQRWNQNWKLKPCNERCILFLKPSAYIINDLNIIFLSQRAQFTFSFIKSKNIKIILKQCYYYSSWQNFSQQI